MYYIKEGELYKIIVIDDISIEIRYGYYDEKDRYSKYNEPIPIFPDLFNNKLYTKTGVRIVTKMQEICDCYDGMKDVTECYGCKYYKEYEDLIGVCKK